MHDLKSISETVAEKKELYLSQSSYNDNNELVFMKNCWFFRGKAKNRGIKIKLGNLESVDYELACAMRDHIQAELKKGVHHRLARETFNKLNHSKTVKEAFYAQYESRLEPHLTSHRQKYGNFNNHIAPRLGDMLLDDVRVMHIDALMRTIKSKNIRAVVLTLIRKLFEFAYQNELIEKNRFRDLSRNAYGIKKSGGGKTLCPEEIHLFFKACKTHNISRIDLLAMSLYLTLAVRKCELTEARWSEFNLEDRIWHLTKERAKENHSIAIPLPQQVVAWLRELKSYDPNSEYLFPSRKKSNSLTLNESTLNKIMKPVFDEMGITVHGTRHTAYTILEMLGIPVDVREVCLNHRNKLTYGHWMFFEERKVAHHKLANLISPHVPTCPF